ncbi:MAG: hypothetical protein JWQ73_2431 [Variovorax sp.]|nr:hypothetical protein [Variovorax sp.]
MRRGLLSCAVAAWALCSLHADAAPVTLPPPPQVELAQHLGVALPLDAPMTTSDGRRVTLASFFGGDRAVILVPGYYRCAELCGLVMQGVLEALARSGLPSTGWRIVGFSIDPQDTPDAARTREAAYLGYAGFVASTNERPGRTAKNSTVATATASASAPPPIPLSLLTSDEATSTRLTHTIGYAVHPAAGRDAPIDHSAAFVVATPDGRIARYFPGVRYDARDLRLAIVEAAGGRIGTLSDKLTLLCGHYDPATGRYSSAVTVWLRVLGVAGVLVLFGWIWRRRHAVPSASTKSP